MKFHRMNIVDILLFLRFIREKLSLWSRSNYS